MKFFLFILIISAELFSATAVKTMVNAKSIDLYRLPFETSQKRSAYYKKGDILHVSACNKYGWCKSEHGYVKKHLLKFYDVQKYRYKPLQKHTVVRKKIRHPEEVIDLQLYTPEKKEQVREEITLLKEENNLSKMALAYDIYFANKSSLLKIKEKH